MKRWLGVPVTLTGLLSFSGLVHAHCPLCTAAIGGAVLGAEYFGLGAGIAGLFVGAFAISTGLWLAGKIKTQYFPFQTPLLVLASFLLTVIPLQYLSSQTFFFPALWFGTSGSAFNQVYFLNKLLVGSVLGAVLSLLALRLHRLLKAWKGRVFFPFQGVVLTLAVLLVSSGILFVAWNGG